MRGEDRFHGRRRLFVGPSLITKTIQPDGTSPVFLREDKHKTARGSKSTTALHYDPYGLSSHDLHYSLGKHKRWMIPDIITSDIASLQREDMNLRVSASMHTLKQHKPPRVTRTLINELEGGIVYMGDARLQISANPTSAYHDVVDDREIHIYSNHGARLRTLTAPPNPKRKRDEKRRREHNEGEVTEVAHDEYNNPIHIRYSILDCVAPSKHAFTTSRRQPKTTAGAGKSKKGNCQRRRLIDYEEDEYFYEAEDEIEELDEEQAQKPNDSHEIAQYIVFKEKRTKRKSPSLQSWEEIDLDEEFEEKLSLNEPSTSSSADSESEQRELVVIHVPITEPSEVAPKRRPWKRPDDMKKKLTLARDVYEWRNVFAFPSRSDGILLPVHPPAMLVHRKNSQKALGQQLTQCVIVKKECDGTRAYIVEKCPTCPSAARNRRMRRNGMMSITDEHLPSHSPRVTPPELCPTCLDTCGDGFALQCGHVFCVRCWYYHANEEYNKGREKILCLKSGCSQHLSYTASRALLSNESVLLYSQAMEKRIPYAIRCPNCRTQFKRMALVQRMLCGCGTMVCVTCQQPDHRPLSCSLYTEYVKLTKDGMRDFAATTPTYVVDKLTVCPVCAQIAQKDGGCNHMTCQRCRTSFCFRCGSTNYSHDLCVQKDFNEMILVDHIDPLKTPPNKEVERSLEPRAAFAEIRKQIGQRLHSIPDPLKARAEELVRTAIRVIEFTMIDEMMRKRTSAEVNRPVVRQLYTAFYRFINGDDDVERIRHKCKNLRRAIDAVQG